MLIKRMKGKWQVPHWYVRNTNSIYFRTSQELGWSWVELCSRTFMSLRSQWRTWNLAHNGVNLLASLVDPSQCLVASLCHSEILLNPSNEDEQFSLEMATTYLTTLWSHNWKFQGGTHKRILCRAGIKTKLNSWDWDEHRKKKESRKGIAGVRWRDSKRRSEWEVEQQVLLSLKEESRSRKLGRGDLVRYNADRLRLYKVNGTGSVWYFPTLERLLWIPSEQLVCSSWWPPALLP